MRTPAPSKIDRRSPYQRSDDGLLGGLPANRQAPCQESAGMAGVRVIGTPSDGVRQLWHRKQRISNSMKVRGVFPINTAICMAVTALATQPPGQSPEVCGGKGGGVQKRWTCVSPCSRG